MYRKIMEEIRKSGGEAYIVGGYVRDMLMGKCSKDIDIEVFGIEPERLERILSKFGSWKKAGRDFEVYLIKGYEISYPRDKNGISPYLSIERASKRRDLTINALYYDPFSGEVLDFNGGIEDIKKGVIRHIEEDSFLEDPLRMLRVAQFRSRFNFYVASETKKLLKENFYRMSGVNGDRIFIELEKILMKTDKPSLAFEFLQENGLLAQIFPDLSQLKGVEQDKVYHPEGDVFYHTMMCLDVLDKEDRSLPVMLAVLFHDIGKSMVSTVEIFQDGHKLIAFPGHSEASYKRYLEFIEEFTQNKKLIKSSSQYILYHEEPLKMLLQNRVDKISIRKLAVKVNIPDLLKVYKADVLGRGKEDNSEELALIEEIKRLYLEVKNELKPIVRGRNLLEWGMRNRREFSRVLGFLYEKQLEEKFSTIDEAHMYFETIADKYGW